MSNNAGLDKTLTEEIDKEVENDTNLIQLKSVSAFDQAKSIIQDALEQATSKVL